MSVPEGAGERLRGLRLLATAATRGIGLAVAAQSAREGAEVALSGSRQATVAEAVRVAGAWGGRVHGLVLDVTDAASIATGVAEARARMGGIDALFLNVPGARPGSLAGLAETDWLGAFELYVLSALRLVGACEADLAAASPGRVVIVTSCAAVEAIPGLTLSNVVRPAVHALVREMARELGPRGLLVNAVAPGRVDTERVRAVDRAAAEAHGTSVERVRADQAAAIPLGRYAAPEELARAAVFLLSRENTYVNGQCLLVDGGLVRSP